MCTSELAFFVVRNNRPRVLTNQKINWLRKGGPVLDMVITYEPEDVTLRKNCNVVVN
jgi:hypothetical protein